MAAIKHAFTNAKSDGGDATVARPSDWNAGHIGSPMPLDRYAIDGTYGDDFTAASLDGKWTRRNFTSGAETYQLGIEATYMRVAMTGRAVGDGYFQTAPAGDWTFMLVNVQRFLSSSRGLFNLCVINSVGTGLGNGFFESPNAFIVAGITTYTTYSGSFQQEPNSQMSSTYDSRKLWQTLRKSGTNYYGAYSFDGELWSPETPAFSSAITVDRIGIMWHPLGAMVSTVVADIDSFNKIA